MGLYKISDLVYCVLFVLLIIFKIYEYILGWVGMCVKFCEDLRNVNIFIGFYGLGLFRFKLLFGFGCRKNFLILYWFILERILFILF